MIHTLVIIFGMTKLNGEFTTDYPQVNPELLKRTTTKVKKESYGKIPTLKMLFSIFFNVPKNLTKYGTNLFAAEFEPMTGDLHAIDFSGHNFSRCHTF